MAPTQMRGKKADPKSEEHRLSEEESSSEGETEKGLTLSDKQMASVSLLVRSAVSAAVAQVLPLANLTAAQNAAGSASADASAQHDLTGKMAYDNKNKDDEHEDGEVRDEVLDDYERALSTLLGDTLITGPDISDKVGRLLERCLGSPLDDKVVKEKRDAHPRPANLDNLKVPRTNSMIFGKASLDHQNLDRGIQLTQSYLVAGITAVGRQAEKLLRLVGSCS